MIDGIETETTVVTAMMALSGVVIGWLGYRIRHHGDVHLIAGYHDGMRADKEALARVVGRVVLVVAAVTVLAGLVYPVLNTIPPDEVTYWSGYTVVVVLLSGYAVSATRRYGPEP